MSIMNNHWYCLWQSLSTGLSSQRLWWELSWLLIVDKRHNRGTVICFVSPLEMQLFLMQHNQAVLTDSEIQSVDQRNPISRFLTFLGCARIWKLVSCSLAMSHNPFIWTPIENWAEPLNKKTSPCFVLKNEHLRTCLESGQDAEVQNSSYFQGMHCQVF